MAREEVYNLDLLLLRMKRQILYTRRHHVYVFDSLDGTKAVRFRSAKL